MKVFANISNGSQTQIKVTGDLTKIFDFISNYEGDDLGSDLVCEDFEETGVIIEAN